MAGHRLEPVGELLDGRVPRQAPQLRRSGAANRRTEALTAQVDEALPRRHALVLLEGVVPRLSQPAEVIGRHPCSVRGRPALSPEKLLAVIEPIQGILRTIICLEVQAVSLVRQPIEAAPASQRVVLVVGSLVGTQGQTRTCGRRCRSSCRAGAGGVEQQSIHAAVQGARCIGSPMVDGTARRGRRWDGCPQRGRGVDRRGSGIGRRRRTIRPRRDWRRRRRKLQQVERYLSPHRLGRGCRRWHGIGGHPVRVGDERNRR